MRPTLAKLRLSIIARMLVSLAEIREGISVGDNRSEERLIVFPDKIAH